jgi:hypothetical protein
MHEMDSGYVMGDHMGCGAPRMVAQLIMSMLVIVGEFDEHADIRVKHVGAI